MDVHVNGRIFGPSDMAFTAGLHWNRPHEIP